MARNVACKSWITSVPLCAADIVRLFVDGEAVVPEQPLELHCHTETRNSSSHDDDFLLTSHGNAHDSLRIKGHLCSEAAKCRMIVCLACKHAGVREHELP